MHSLEEQEEEKEEDEEKVKEKVNRIERMTIETHAEVMEGVDDQTSSTFLVKDFVASSSSSSLDDFLHSDSESSIDEETESWMATELMLLKTHEEQEEQEQEENLKENPVGEVVLEPEVIHPNSLKSPPLSTSTNLTSSLSWSDPVHAFHPLTHDEEEETQKQILNQLRKDLIEQTQRYFEQCFFLEQAQRSMNTLERSILKKRSHLHELKRHAHGIQVNSKRETRVAYEKEHSRTKALLHQSRVFSQRWTWELTQWTSWISQNNGIETGITHSPFGGLPALHIFLQEKQKELMDLKQHSNTLTLDYKELEVLYVFERDRQTCIDGQVNAKRSLPTTQETPSHLPSEDDPSFRLESSSSSSSSANKRNRGPFMPSSPPVVDVKTYFYSARPTSSVEKRGIAFKWVLDPSSHHILALDLSSPPPPSSSHEDASTLSSTSEVAVLDEVPYLIQASHLLVADLHGNQIHDIESLKEWTHLMWLNVAHCPTFPSLYHGFQTSFEGTFLVYLDLSHCGFIDMMVLTFPCLMHLNISHNQIKHLQLLHWLPLLHTLLAHENQIETLQPFLTCPNLSILDLHNNALSDPSELFALHSCPHLTSCDLTSNPWNASSMTPPGSWLPKGFLKSLSTTILTTPTLSTVFFLRPLPPSLPSSSSSSSSSSSCPPSPLTYVVALLARFLSKYFPVHAPRVVLEHPPTTSPDVNLEVQLYGPVHEFRKKLLPLSSQFEPLLQALHPPSLTTPAAPSLPLIVTSLPSFSLPSDLTSILHAQNHHHLTTTLVTAMTVRFQAHCRGVLVRTHLHRMKSHLVFLQAMYRRKWTQKIHAVRVLQRAWKHYVQRRRHHPHGSWGTSGSGMGGDPDEVTQPLGLGSSSSSSSSSTEVDDFSSLESLSDIDPIDVPDSLDAFFDTHLLQKLETLQETTSHVSLDAHRGCPEDPVHSLSMEDPKCLKNEALLSSVGVSVGLKHFEKKRHQLNQDVDWFTKQQTGASSPLTLPSSSSPSDSQPPRPWLPPLLPPKYEYAYQWDWSSTHDGGGRGGKTGDESFASLSSTSTKKTPTLATSFKDDLTSTTLFPPLSNLSSYGVSRLDPSTYHLETAMIQHVIQHGTPLKPLGTTVGCYVSHSSPPPPSSSSSSSSTH